jgi:hypothetical protein
MQIYISIFHNNTSEQTQEKKNATYDDEHPSSGLKHAQKCDGV